MLFKIKGFALEPYILILVLFAAALHAGWNLILKTAPDKAVAIMIILFASLPLAIMGLVIGGVPTVEAAPVIVISALLQTGYNISLFKAYNVGQLSSVYPVARGSAPLFIFIISYSFYEPKISEVMLFGIAVICFGLITYGLVQLWRNRSSKRQLLLALLNGFFIALYSLTDAYGTKLTGSALSFLCAMALLSRLFLFLYLFIFEKDFLPRLRSGFELRFIFGGITSFICYLIILQAYQHLPVALVSSLRETSILFAVVLGIIVLKEKLAWEKIYLVIILFLGIAVLSTA